MIQIKQALEPEDMQKFSFLDSFSMNYLEKIAQSAPLLSLKAGRIVYSQDDISTTMFLIVKGRVKIERKDASGETIFLGEYSEPNLFGEQAILTAEPRAESVTTTTDSEFLVINRAMMLDFIRKCDPDEILGIFSMLSEQMRSVDEREFQHVLSNSILAARMEVEKQRALTEMVAGLAHEINTPLGIINTAVSIMARELAEPKEITIQRAAEIAESLELIRRNVERANGLIQDFKKVSVSQLSTQRETIDISEVVQETINLISISLTRKKISINLHDALSIDQKKWNGYRGLLSQILLNFLSNAERYAYPQHAGGAVDVALELDQSDWYRLTVRDHGRGISVENITRVFKPFFTTGHAFGGTGLGLAIVQDLVTNVLKGEISVKSDPGNGAEFTAKFPRVIPESSIP